MALRIFTSFSLRCATVLPSFGLLVSTSEKSPLMSCSESLPFAEFSIWLKILPSVMLRFSS